MTERLPDQPGATPPAETSVTSVTSATRHGKVHRTRTSGLWISLTLAAIVLLVLLVFIIQNVASVTIAFFGARTAMPLGVAMLLAAVCGILLVAIPGYGRIIQLRRFARRGRHN